MTVDRKTEETRGFYDEYWPANVPEWRKTSEHVQDIVPAAAYERVLDAGCGTGVCSLALAKYSPTVVSLDISLKSVSTAAQLSRSVGVPALRPCNGSLLEVPLRDDSFDLVFSWGVIHHTTDPVHALDELIRVLRPGATLVLAVYLKTPLTIVHETVRRLCLRLPRNWRWPLLHGVASLVRWREKLGTMTNVRDDNPYIEAQVEDWYFVPEKHFFSIDELGRLFAERGLTYEVVCEQTGRFRSSSNFIVRGRRSVAGRQPVQVDGVV